MQIKKNALDSTHVTLTITADALTLETAKTEALKALAANVKVAGFRSGKVPLSIVEKNVSPASLQAEFLDRAMNVMYVSAVQQEDLRPIAQPEVSVKKFVPYDTLEIEAKVEVIGEVALGDYKKLRLAKEPVTVTSKEVDEVINRLQVQAAEKKDADRPAKNKDEVWIDFAGSDTKTKEPVKGADGNNYPLLLGSDAFIPGFEKNIVGMKSGEEKTFALDFPKDYGIKMFQDRNVTFKVTVLKVQDVIEPKADDEFAAKVGPFKTMAELKTDIKKQLTSEKQSQADQAYADELLKKLTEKSKIAIPETIVDEEVKRLTTNKQQEVIYRGQAWKEYLDDEGLTEDEFQKKLRPDAELRVKAGLVLAEVAEKENIMVTPEELDTQLQLLRSRYEDPKMRAELAKPEARRDIASRMLTEKTIAKLTEYADAK